MKKTLLPMFFCYLFWSSISSGQESTTVSVRAEPTTQGGNLISCSLIFTALGKDYRSKRGGDIGTTGNFSAYSAPKNPNGPITFGLKLTVYDHIAGEFTPARIAQTHIVTPDGTVWKSADKFIFDGESPGSRIHALFLGDESTKFLEGIHKNKTFTIGFNREANTADVNITIDLGVEATDESTGKVVRSEKSLMAFDQCLLKLLKSLKE